MMQEIIFTPSDFVAVLNQTLDFAYPEVIIEGELSNLRISRGKWVYFDIKDEQASVKCFGTVFMLPGPLEDGMIVRIVANPRMHPLYNFSLNLQSVVPVGEGSIKKASDLLFKKLQKEGLFDDTRKRPIPFAPASIALVASRESAAYADFIKILNARWGGVKIFHLDVQVQGLPAVEDIVNAVNRVNQMQYTPEVIVIVRGGGSVDDLSVFSNELVVRGVAGSRIPTVVAIGHESDTSLAELVADLQASTPSNAAELLVPDKKQIQKQLNVEKSHLYSIIKNYIKTQLDYLRGVTQEMDRRMEDVFARTEQNLIRQVDLLIVLNPETILKRGYSFVKIGKKVVKSVGLLNKNDEISIYFQDGSANATINKVN